MSIFFVLTWYRGIVLWTAKCFSQTPSGFSRNILSVHKTIPRYQVSTNKIETIHCLNGTELDMSDRSLMRNGNFEEICPSVFTFWDFGYLSVGHSFWPRRLIFGMRDPCPVNLTRHLSNFWNFHFWPTYSYFSTFFFIFFVKIERVCRPNQIT